MRNTTNLLLAAVVALTLAACGGTEAGGSGSDETLGADESDGARTTGDVVDLQPPGQAVASVDGREFTLTEPGGIGCTISEDAVTFAFRIGDNEVTLGGGANLYDTGWLGNITLREANPAGEDGPVAYFPDLAVNGDKVAISGSSMSYSGPMLKQPPNDGSNPPPIDIGNGTISVTCG